MSDDLLSGARRDRRFLQSAWRRQLRYGYLRFLRLRSHPQEIARGLAAGVFAGSFPLFGVQTILGVAIATVVRGNKLMAAAGTWVSNPLTYVPIYAFNFQVGRWLLGQSSTTNPLATEQSLQSWMSLGKDVTLALSIGSGTVGLVLASLSYYLGLTLAKRLHQTRQRRRT
jgi:hypothetical protein